MRKDLFDQLCDICMFPAPKTMVKSEFDIIWAEAQKNNEFDSKKSDEENKQEYQKLAERRVKLGMLVAEFGRINQIKIENSELEKAVLERARMYPGYERQVFEFYQKNPKAIGELKGPILEDKVVSKILEDVTKVQKKYSLTEIRELLN
jgi:trigger factor